MHKTDHRRVVAWGWRSWPNRQPRRHVCGRGFAAPRSSRWCLWPPGSGQPPPGTGPHRCHQVAAVRRPTAAAPGRRPASSAAPRNRAVGDATGSAENRSTVVPGTIARICECCRAVKWVLTTVVGPRRRTLIGALICYNYSSWSIVARPTISAFWSSIFGLLGLLAPPLAGMAQGDGSRRTIRLKLSSLAHLASGCSCFATGGGARGSTLAIISYDLSVGDHRARRTCKCERKEENKC